MSQGDRYVLSLDLGTTFGWALGKNGVIIASGSVLLADKDGHSAQPFLRFEQWLFNFKNVDCILYEKVSGFKGFQAAINYGGYVAILKRFCLIHGITTQNMKPNELKKMFTGNGNAKKELMCDVARKLGWQKGMPGTRIDNDEADAVALLWCVYRASGIAPRFASADERET